MGAITQFITNVRAWIVDALVGFFVGWWAWWKTTMVDIATSLWNLFVDLLPDSWVQFCNDLPEKLEDVRVLVEAMMPDGMQWRDPFWVLPILPCALMLGTCFTFCAIIRLVRWIKSCIPTVGD